MSNNGVSHHCIFFIFLHKRTWHLTYFLLSYTDNERHIKNIRRHHHRPDHLLGIWFSRSQPFGCCISIQRYGCRAANLWGASRCSHNPRWSAWRKSGRYVRRCLCDTKQSRKEWNGKTVNDLKHLFESPSAPYAIRLAKAMCKGHKLVQAFTGSADHYCTLNTHNYWTRKAKPVKIIGNHKFYKLN